MLYKFSFLITILLFFFLIIGVNLWGWNIFGIAVCLVWSGLIRWSFLTDGWCAWVVCAWSITIWSCWIRILTSVVGFSFFCIDGLSCFFWRCWCKHCYFLRRFRSWRRWILLCLWFIRRRICLWSWICSDRWWTSSCNDIIWIRRRIRMDKRMTSTVILWATFFLISWRLPFPWRSTCGRGIFFFRCTINNQLSHKIIWFAKL